MQSYFLVSLAVLILLQLTIPNVFAADSYGSIITNNKFGASEKGQESFVGERTPTKVSGVIFKICKNSPWSTFGWDEPSYGTWDQQKLKQEIVSKCKEVEPTFSLWPTGKVYLLIVAPAWNLNEYKVDQIGGVDDPIYCSSRDAGFVKTGGSDSGFMTEIGHNTGVFAGSVSLGGPYYKRVLSESGAYQFGGTNDGDPYSRYGSIKTCGLKASSHGAFTVTWEYSTDQKISKTVKYSYREADIQFGKDIYNIGDTAKVIVHDRDLLRWSWDNKATPVHVWSDTDKAGVNVGVVYDRQFWIPTAADGRNSGYVEITINEESRHSTSGKSALLRVSPGDNIYMAYRDYTMPPPFSQDGCKVPTSYDYIFGKGLIVTEYPDQALADCKYKRIVNSAMISEKAIDSFVSLTTTSEKDLPKIIYASKDPTMKIPDHALTKYSSDGDYMVKIWWEHQREFALGSKNNINISFFDGLAEKQLENVRYDFVFTENDKVLIADKIFSVDGHQTHAVTPLTSGVSYLEISNINGDSPETIKFKINTTDEIFEINPVYYDLQALNNASVDDILRYLEYQDSVPYWVKHSINNWAFGNISDKELIDQIRHLIKNNVL